MAEKSGELNITNQPDADSEAEDRSNQFVMMDAGNGTDENGLTQTSDDPEEIRGQIEETRREMGETIDAIQEKLSISKISEQVKEQVSEQINNVVETAKDAVYGATIGKVGNFMQNVGRDLKKSNIVKAAGENPFPFVLIGLGVGLLLFKSYNRGSSSKNRNRISDGKPNQSSMLKTAQNKVGDLAGQTYENVSSMAGTAYEGVTGAAGSAYRNVAGMAGSTYEKVGDLSVRARESYDYYIEENPLAVGAVALAVGAAVGLALPATSYENDLMGDARDQLMSKAEEVTRGAFEKVQQAANEVGKSISGDAENQSSA